MSTIKVIFCLMLTIAPSLSYGGWSGPQEIIAGTWGSDLGQFYYAPSDTTDSFPREFGVDKDGLVLIADENNKRLLIYNSDGSIKKVITKPAVLPKEDSLYGWPSALVVYGGGNSIVVTCEYQKIPNGIRPSKKCFLDYNGLILTKADMAQVFPIETGHVLLKNNIYSLYSPTGQLIKTSTTRPLELGEVSDKPLSENQYKITVKYPDATYELISEATFMRYVRDAQGSLYGLNDGGVWKFNRCGKEIAELLIPVNQTETITSTKTGRTIPLPVEYGQPVVAPNGDIYTWKKSTFKYSIVKWTWVDDPNVPTGPDAPTGLSVAASINGLYLTWTASPNRVIQLTPPVARCSVYGYGRLPTDDLGT